MGELGQRSRNCGTIIDRVRNSFLFQCVQIKSGAHPACYWMRAESASLRDKADGAWIWPLAPPSVELENEWLYISLPSKCYHVLQINFSSNITRKRGYAFGKRVYLSKSASNCYYYLFYLFFWTIKLIIIKSIPSMLWLKAITRICSEYV